MIRDARGSVSAEFAVTVPAVVVVIVLAVSALGVGGRQVRLEQGVAQAARLAARGESAERIASAVAVVPGSRSAVERTGDTVCVAASAASGTPLPLPDLHARSCALAGETGDDVGGG